MKYFDINELCQSSIATERKIGNSPNFVEKKCIVELIDKLLDPIREQWTEYCIKNSLGTGSITVNSGFRCYELNNAVGGVKTSAHLMGYAADLHPSNGKQAEFESFMVNVFAKSGVKYDQIILERSGSSRWVHVGLYNRDGQQRKQCFKLSV